jgi:rare lipoprotein A
MREVTATVTTTPRSRDPHTFTRLSLTVVLLAACGGGARKARTTGKPRPVSMADGVQEGLATWYGGSLHGKPTASGEPFNKHGMTAAHRKLRFNSRVRVTNKRNGKSVEVRINDRGPYGRAVIDLSEAAARKLDMIDAGVVPVRIELMK